MFIIIDIYSKDYCELKNFVQNFLNKKVCSKLKLIVLRSNLQKKKKKKLITILTSPHVNKNAQEQFGYNIYRKRLKCLSFQSLLFLLFLKKIKYQLSSSISIKINIIKNINNSKINLKNKFNINNYFLDYKTFNLIDYLNFLEISGELILKSK